MIKPVGISVHGIHSKDQYQADRDKINNVLITSPEKNYEVEKIADRHLQRLRKTPIKTYAVRWKWYGPERPVLPNIDCGQLNDWGNWDARLQSRLRLQSSLWIKILWRSFGRLHGFMQFLHLSPFMSLFFLHMFCNTQRINFSRKLKALEKKSLLQSLSCCIQKPSDQTRRMENVTLTGYADLVEVYENRHSKTATMKRTIWSKEYVRLKKRLKNIDYFPGLCPQHSILGICRVER